MSAPFIGEIRMFAGNFAPVGWAFCNGQLLPIVENEALFALIGTIYGGDGQSTFGLPDLRGRRPVHPGQGPGLSSYQLGEVGGAENVTPTFTHIPPHSHTAGARKASPDTGSPSGTLLAAPGRGAAVYSTGGGNAPMSNTTAAGGGGQPVSILPPQLGISHIIALEGIFPQTN